MCHSRLEQLTTGVGEPATVFAHGLAGDIAGTRPLGSGVSGRRVFFHFRGHGRSSAPPGPWTFGDLADDLRSVADQAGATRAVGVSMGAVALCRLLTETPDRFERVVLFLPARLDGAMPSSSDRLDGAMPSSSDRLDGLDGSAPSSSYRLDRLLAAIASGPAAAVAQVVEAEIPPPMRDTPSGRAYLRRRVEQLRRDGLAPELATLWDTPAVPDLTPLRKVTARVLVIACVGEAAHPVAVASQLAAALPDASLHVYDQPAVLWTNRADLRQRISIFLNP